MQEPKKRAVAGIALLAALVDDQWCRGCAVLSPVRRGRARAEAGSSLLTGLRYLSFCPQLFFSPSKFDERCDIFSI